MKRMSLMVLAAFFILAQFAGGAAFGKDAECKVVSVQGNEMVLDCGSEAGNYQAGMPVKVVPAKKKKAIEGC